MKKSSLFFLSLLFSVVSIAQSNLTANNRALAKEAALQNAQSFLQLIPQGQEKDYGFASRSDFDKIKIGDPYQTYFMVKQANEVVFADVNEWRVPLIVDGKYVALATVKVTNGKGEMVDFGATVLASHLQTFEKQHNGKNERVLVRNTVLVKDFIAPNFSSLVNPTKSGEFFSINSKASNLLYPISNKNLKPVKINSLQSQTIATPIQ